MVSAQRLAYSMTLPDDHCYQMAYRTRRKKVSVDTFLGDHWFHLATPWKPFISLLSTHFDRVFERCMAG